MGIENIAIAPPVRGEWAIAYDFLATKGTRLPYPGSTFARHIFGSISVEATNAWRQPVFAPCDGVVVGCSDGTPDRERISMVRDLVRLLAFPVKPGSPLQAYGGNYVLLQCGDGYPLLAHLRSGSLHVTVGDRVRSGDQVGDVGNSGSSIQPHLHFQVMANAHPFPLFKNLLPFKFRGVSKRVGREWKAMAITEITNGDHLRL